VTAVLEAQGLTKTFQGLVAVDDFSFSAEPGCITSLIGPNGAGKTTAFNCLTGLLEPDRGRVWLGGEDITDLATHRRAQKGLGRTFQRLEVFTGMSVFDNLQVAAEAGRPGRVIADIWRLRHPNDREVVRQVEEVLELVGLTRSARTIAGDLSTGTLRLVELGRALCIRPKVLLLDEPGSGLDGSETAHLATVLSHIAESGIAVLLVEHDVELVMSISATVYVMEYGRLIASGTPQEIAANPAVLEAYLGTTPTAHAGAADR
jgi:branched-chain amino acid transport system ATP-binding protein